MIFVIFRKSLVRMFANRIPIQKKNSDFRKVIFSVKKFFAKNRVFSIFTKKIGRKIRIFGNEGYFSKEKNEPDFSTSSPWKSNGNYARKFFFYGKWEKNRYSRSFRLIFLKLTEKVSLNVSRRCLKCRKNPSKI